MSNKTLKEHAEMLKRTAANATERAKVAEAEVERLNREILLLKRTEGKEEKAAIDAATKHLDFAIDASSKASAFMKEFMEDQERRNASLKTTLDAIIAREASLPKGKVVTDDDLLKEVASLHETEKKLRRQVDELTVDNMRILEAFASEKNGLVADRDNALQLLKNDRVALKATRDIIIRVAHRLPKNWQKAASSSALATALVKQVPNIALAVLAEMLEVFWSEWQRLDAENKALGRGDNWNDLATVSAAELKPEPTHTNGKINCLAVLGQKTQIPPLDDCWRCQVHTDCHNESKTLPTCFMLTTKGPNFAAFACELCAVYESCQNAEKN